MARPQWMASMGVIKFYVMKNQIEWTRERADFELMYIKRKIANYLCCFMELWLPRSKIFQMSAQWPASGMWRDLHSVWEAVPTSSCGAFQFYEPSVSDTIWFYYRWVFEMKTCSSRKTVSFFVKMLPPLPQRVPSWSRVWHVSPAREVFCVGAALCSCDVQPSGPWGCAGNTLLIHMPSPAGISKMGPLVGAVKQPGPPSPTPSPSTWERKGHEEKYIKIQECGMMVGWSLRITGQKASDFPQSSLRICDQKYDTHNYGS